ncbi:PucR family transcriptional regulator ligand-binding domain-containing protein [Fictibacillus enclensis]|uniref:PucR family transcriptional regulator n=1 Tax=Fictibacillus enclensis TaxID=1017270 RepID=UPI0025A22E19|nr:PucR family transcriptional regulator [Fictibacillus enclensis]MDM5198101.1 PucR family transcriptional regulator ligand-binding domain-containing protein [Fictibacillus enclensis]
MKLAVNDLLSLEIMENARVRTGSSHLRERYVQWISAIEMPLENFVRKNEVVLSTAIGCGHDVQLFKKFVEDIIHSEASALIIALGRYIFDVPKEVVELAEKHQFIIMEIPWEVRFSTIIEEVLRELNDIQHKERERSEKAQQELLQLILKETSLREISYYIQNQIGCSIVITDRAGIIQDRMEAGDPDDKWKYYNLKDGISIKKTSSLLPQDPMYQKFQMIELGGETILRLPILNASGDVQGYLFVLFPNDCEMEEFLTQYRVNVLEHSATTIALWLSRQNAIEETEMRLRSDFIQELAKGEFTSDEQAESRAKLLGFNLKVPYVCIAGYPENLELLFKKRKQYDLSYEHWLDSMIRYIEEEIYYAAGSLEKEVMMTYQGEKLTLFVQAKNNENPAHHFLDLVERRLRNLLPDVVISWGIGGAQETIAGFKTGFDHAQTALQIGRKKKGAGHRVLYENTKVDRVLLTLAQNKEMKEIIVSAIEPLIQYDQQRNMDLIGTFRTYNECHGNVSQTARLLNLHRQSLLYRLRKVETLTGLSLIDTDDLFLLDLSIKTWKLGIAETPVHS